MNPEKLAWQSFKVIPNTKDIKRSWIWDWNEPKTTLGGCTWGMDMETIGELHITRWITC